MKSGIFIAGLVLMINAYSQQNMQLYDWVFGLAGVVLVTLWAVSVE